MRPIGNTRVHRGVLTLAVGLAYALIALPKTQAADRPQLNPGESNWVKPQLRAGERRVIETEDLNTITREQMVAYLLNLPSALSNYIR